MFDLDIFSRVCAKAYKEVETPYTLQEVMDVFTYFFYAYRDAMGEEHPPVRREQIARIIQAMPYYDKPPNTPGYTDIEPDAYPALIEAYFHTPFRNCDYRINHFFSGDIRSLRMYEVLY